MDIFDIPSSPVSAGVCVTRKDVSLRCQILSQEWSKAGAFTNDQYFRHFNFRSYPGFYHERVARIEEREMKNES